MTFCECLLVPPHFFSMPLLAGRTTIPLLPTYRAVAEPLDVSFIACIEQYWSIALLPVLICYQVSLLERTILIKAKVINL